LINDTTNPTVLAGQKISRSEVRGTCDMHVFELAIKHWTGIRTRRRNNVVWDQFPEFIELQNKFKNLISWIMNMKSKKRYENYKKSHSDQVLGLVVPNDTRVSGVHIMFVTLTRSMHALDRMYGDKNKSNQLRLQH
jgi:hypothetical protein